MTKTKDLPIPKVIPQAQGDHLLVVRAPLDDQVGGIIIPGTTKQVAKCWGRVVSVGDDVKSAEVDDMVFFLEHESNAIGLHDDTGLLVLRDMSVVATSPKKELTKQGMRVR